MNIDKLFEDKEYLDKEIAFFKGKKHISRIEENKELALSHLKKARHNMGFYKLNKEAKDFEDWLIVVLYYALYHSALALITDRKFTSKNHYATILILIKEYSITKEEAELIDKLCISKEDAELYTHLKNDRHDASYSTSIRFDQKQVLEYEDKVIDFINKAEALIS